MKDIRLVIKVRNNLLMKKREEQGLTSKELADKIGIPYPNYCALESCRISPLKKRRLSFSGPYVYNGEYIDMVHKIAEYYSCLPEDLFSDTIKSIVKNKISKEIEGEKIKLFAESLEYQEPLLLPEKKELERDVEAAISRLTEREYKILKMRYFEDKTLCEIAKSIGRTTESARQQIIKAERKIRHGSMSKILMDHLYD